MLALAAPTSWAASTALGQDDPDFATSPDTVSTVPFNPTQGTVRDYLESRDDIWSPLGIDVRAAARKLKSGEEKVGLLVVAVTSGGPADKAGLRALHHRMKSALEVASIAGAFFFPPAVMLVPILESTSVGESSDLIVAVDGFRVTDVLDFEDCMRDAKPGEIVYLSLVRDGVRIQLPVALPRVPPSPQD
jgi:S1-C subfamily serine protease